MSAFARGVSKRSEGDVSIVSMHDDSTPADVLCSRIRDEAQARLVLDDIEAIDGDPLMKARWLMVADRLARRFPGLADPEHWRSQAFACVAEVVRQDVELPRKPATVQLDSDVEARCPARIDLAGGWSDTPPICHGIGGTVLNAAVRIQGQRPVYVRIRVNADRVMRIRFDDVDDSIVIHDGVWPLKGDSLGRWDALPRAALALTGLAPPDRGTSLDAWLGETGTGLDIEFGTGLPRGSGMGTSSILGASLLSAMSTAAGADLEFDTLCARTSVLEQMIGAGGGWQDQGGGVVGGLKLLRTVAGRRQVPSVQRLAPTAAFITELESRLVLVFTGIRRVAAGILSNVVERFLAREPALMGVLGDLTTNAERMAATVAAEDVDAFASCLAAYWRHKVTIDPASTNRDIDAQVEPLQDLLSAWELPGAGGGGFLLLLAKDAGCADAIRGRLRDAGRHDSIHDIRIDPAGLSVRHHRPR